jgi:hypothetical protein
MVNIPAAKTATLGFFRCTFVESVSITEKANGAALRVIPVANMKRLTIRGLMPSLTR